MKGRRRSRVVALQALYEIDCVSHPPSVVLYRLLSENTLAPSYADFTRHLVNGVLAHQDVLDQFIHEHAPEWPLEQMAYVDRNILRMAVFEFAIDGGTPIKVAINEAVELAKWFGSDSAPRFVNGVLGSLVDRIDAISAAAHKRERKS
ncbi:MAG: transcription antitermination factor NusB [Anaerolineae bacterium]|jgi:N utilization substance protein B